jgi:hypothetical protein
MAIFCLLLRIFEVIVGKTLFLSIKTKKLSSLGMFCLFDFISSCKKTEKTLKYCFNLSCFSGLFALRRIPSQVILNYVNLRSNVLSLLNNSETLEFLRSTQQESA